ncbi:hypothetical protein AK830_g830 [Neonectria ditissima]|uniref:Uncharacterized protein n=1 Tax=Neonectria ditissima TaxID=78410 RepID=A0A0P7BVJ7_9HYPO|nr:hypothetical protein AK830_g830 [Neonectria ditissima]
MTGTLVPSWYRADSPSCNDLAIVSVVWGLSLGLSAFGVIRAGNQTYHQWKRTRRVTAYMVFIWLELVASTVLGGMGWGHVYGIVPPSFELFFFIIVFWIFQIHCIMQIIINRIALLAVSPTTARRLRWGVFGILAVINISVGSVWIPARLQINPTWIRVNEIYDRLEKAIFAVMDVGLNLYFVHLVRSSLVEYGLTKYVLLYRFNLAMVVLSLTMDVSLEYSGGQHVVPADSKMQILIIATMSLNNTFLYVIFHPLAYLVKLHIELSMADLIANIVKAAGSDLTCNCTCHPSNVHPFVYDLAAQPRYHVPAKPGRIASLRDRMRRPWPAPLRIFRRENEEEELHSFPGTSTGLRMLPRTEELPWRSHPCAIQPARKDSGRNRQAHDALVAVDAPASPFNKVYE